MKRDNLLLLFASPLALGGCAASIAASAVGAAIQASKPPETHEDLRQPGILACTRKAAEQGEVHIIDSQQRPGGRVVVWGTIESAGERKAFECLWKGEVRDFDIRRLAPRVNVEVQGQDA